MVSPNVTTPPSAHRLGQWFRANARDLPWRTVPRDPYLVLLSEVMLQQTQVERVLPRFAAFVARFPSFEALARAPEAEVLELWSGLGYYRRARMLWKAAGRVVAESWRPPFPVEDLRRLPGVGEYTAAAVASLAFGAPEPAMDGNVRRVASRFLALREDPAGASGRARIARWVRSLMEAVPPQVVNEALMDLGATVCRPRDPRCRACPLADDCRARAAGEPLAYPRPSRGRDAEARSWVVAWARSETGKVLLRRVTEGPILVGLWLPPWTELAGKRADGGPGDLVSMARSLLPVPARLRGRADTVAHTITYRRIRVLPVIFSIRVEEPLPGGWVLAHPDRPGVPTSSLLGKLAAALEAE